jgi:hypothetical protein
MNAHNDRDDRRRNAMAAFLVLNAMAVLLTADAYLISIRRYPWAEGPMAEQIDPEAVPAIVILLVAASVFATAAFLIKARSRPALLTFLVLAGACAYRLAQVAPLSIG